MISNHAGNQGERISVKIDAEFESIIPGFIEEWKSDIRFLKRALAKNDYATIYRYGHDMKGTGGACGFPSITILGAGIERAARDRDPEAIRNRLNSLSAYLKRVDVTYIRQGS